MPPGSVWQDSNVGQETWTFMSIVKYNRNKQTPLFHPTLLAGLHSVVRSRLLVLPGHLLVCTQNNHTETVLIKLLPGPLSLASYWLTLTSWFNPFLIIYITTWLWLTGMSLTSVCLRQENHLPHCLLPWRIQFCCPHLSSSLSKGQGSFFI